MADGRLIRVKLAFERDFAQIPNEWLRDSDLSLRARGLLGLLMSHREGYTVTHRSLAAQNPEGLSAIEGAVRELKSAKYLVIVKERGRGGRIESWSWILTDPKREKSRSQPELDLPDLAQPDLAEPDLDNRHLKEAHLQEHLTTQVNEIDPSTGAGIEKDASGDFTLVADPESPADKYARLTHQMCPRRHGKEHAYDSSNRCMYCLINLGQYWAGNDIRWLSDLEGATTSLVKS